MLFKDFLKNNAETLSQSKILFDWSWPHSRYELKINSQLRITHRHISKSGKVGGWTEIGIGELREFKVLTVSCPPRKKLLKGDAVIVITTDDGMRG